MNYIFSMLLQRSFLVLMYNLSQTAHIILKFPVFYPVGPPSLQNGRLPPFTGNTRRRPPASLCLRGDSRGFRAATRSPSAPTCSTRTPSTAPASRRSPTATTARPPSPPLNSGRSPSWRTLCRSRARWSGSARSITTGWPPQGGNSIN